MTNIVVVGGGFGGLGVALGLEKVFRRDRFDKLTAGKNITVTLIDIQKDRRVCRNFDLWI